MFIIIALLLTVLVSGIFGAVPAVVSHRRVSRRDAAWAAGLWLAVWVFALCAYHRPGLTVGFHAFRLVALTAMTGWAGLVTAGLRSLGRKGLKAVVPLTGDAFLELCFAVILSAVGAAIVFNIGASTGGTDIVAMILNKYTSMPVGRALMVSDLGIVLVGAYLYGPATGLYCILGMILKSTVADSAIESINLRKVCTVVTSNPQPVRDFIVNDLHRSATMEQAEGAYTHDEKWVLTTVLTRGQAQKLRLHVRGLDDHAFITIVNSSEIVGKGFRAI